jgi:hypothetical protein
MYKHLNSGFVFAYSFGNLADVRARYTITGAPTIVDSPLGKAMYFDDSHDGVTLGSSEEYHFRFDAGTQDFSVVVWMMSTTEDYCEIIDKRDGLNDGWHLGIQANGIPLFRLNALAETGPAGVSVADGLWHSIAVTVDRDGDMIVYVDGAGSAGEAVGGAVMATTTLPTIGHASYFAGNRYGGAIRAVATIDRILSLAEVQELAAA